MTKLRVTCWTALAHLSRWSMACLRCVVAGLAGSAWPSGMIDPQIISGLAKGDPRTDRDPPSSHPEVRCALAPSDAERQIWLGLGIDLSRQTRVRSDPALNRVIHYWREWKEGP
jgi:hypothetical protein